MLDCMSQSFELSRKRCDERERDDADGPRTADGSKHKNPPQASRQVVSSSTRHLQSSRAKRRLNERTATIRQGQVFAV